MINRIEEILINAYPASNMILSNGFLIRLHSTREVCSINKIGNSNFDLSAVIRANEKKLRQWEINPNYRILHDKNYENLDVELMRNGYDVIYRGVVMGINIADMQKELFRFANLYEQGIHVFDGVDENWIQDYKVIKEIDDFLEEILSKNLQDSYEEILTFVLVQEERLLAMAYATIIGNYLVINDIFVREKYRDLDYGKKMTKAILTKGLQRNCDMVICDLREEETSALHMLEKEGFKKMYSYQYRGKKV